MRVKDNICFFKLDNIECNKIISVIGDEYYNYYYVDTISELIKIQEKLDFSLIVLDKSINTIKDSVIKSFTIVLYIGENCKNDEYCVDINNKEFLYYFIKTLCRVSWINKLNKNNDHIETIDLIDKLDSHTKKHSANVMEYAIKIGKKLNFSKKNLEKISIAALLHDIGKTVIPKEILMSPKRLNDAQYEIIKLHTTFLCNLDSDELIELRDIIRHHHEKYDGTGYPDKISGDKIPLFSRIITVVDSFDAMTSKRIYNTPISFEEGINILIKDANTHFDPKIVEIFIDILKKEIKFS